jgi:alanine-synthesizing transaminase
MVISGTKLKASDYIEGIELLASMRLCSNVPGQHAIQTALGGYQSINDLVAPGGRLCRQRDLAYKLLTDIPGISCVKPKGAMYLFARMDPEVFHIKDDEKMVLDLLLQEKILIVQGSAFNWPSPDHFRIVFLPREDELEDAISRLKHFFAEYEQ